MCCQKAMATSYKRVWYKKLLIWSHSIKRLLNGFYWRETSYGVPIGVTFLNNYRTYYLLITIIVLWEALLYPMSLAAHCCGVVLNAFTMMIYWVSNTQIISFTLLCFLFALVAACWIDWWWSIVIHQIRTLLFKRIFLVMECRLCTWVLPIL